MTAKVARADLLAAALDIIACGRVRHDGARNRLPDLFGDTRPTPTLVRLARGIDRDKPCCENLAVIRAGQGPHAAELRCAGCGAHRGWLRREALEFLNTTARRFGAPAGPIILRDNSIGDHVMSDKKYENSGILFRNDRKDGERDRDYSGSINIDGRDFWLSGWIKAGKNGKFLSLAVKPKQDAPAPAAKAARGTADEFDDAIPF